MTAFVKRIGIANTGRNINDVKNQLSRIASSILRVSYKLSNERTINADLKLIKAYDLWFPEDEVVDILVTTKKGNTGTVTDIDGNFPLGCIVYPKLQKAQV